MIGQAHVLKADPVELRTSPRSRPHHIAGPSTHMRHVRQPFLELLPSSPPYHRQ